MLKLVKKSTTFVEAPKDMQRLVDHESKGTDHDHDHAEGDYIENWSDLTYQDKKLKERAIENKKMVVKKIVDHERYIQQKVGFIMPHE